MQLFDLNIEQVLEHWTVAHAVREFLANALDEHLLGHGAPPEVWRDDGGDWHIRDFGRGLRHEHFTQNENPEKLESSEVVGRFGVGLKDALAVLDRHRIGLRIHTPTADITTGTHPKAGFPDTLTLHAEFRPASRAGMMGTEVVLTGVDDAEIDEAKRFFLRWSDERVLDRTPYGDLLSAAEEEGGRIYVRGVRVAEEETFLFSYNVTKLNARLTRALNRERSNVGRQAYGERVKDILLSATSTEAMRALADDLGQFETGAQHTESTWVDVALHAAQILSAGAAVVFVTPAQLAQGGPLFDYARDEGKQLIVVPTKVAEKLRGAVDANGDPIRTLDVFANEWMRSFEFTFVDPFDLTPTEAETFALVDVLYELVGVKPGRWPVLISETMRPGARGADAAGFWDGSRIVIRRDQLRRRRAFCGTLLHEVAHARSGFDDATLEFEQELTDLLARVADRQLSNRSD